MNNNHCREKRQGGDKTEKIQKVLARCGLGSRRLMETWLTEKKITVNGQLAVIGARVGGADEIKVDGRPVRQLIITTRLLLYYKRRGEIVERGAENAVFDCLPSVAGGRWLNVGRLDVATEGLLLFTTDGELAARLSHPGGGMKREYRARTDGELSGAVMTEICQHGVDLGGGRRVRPLYFSSTGKPSEGRNHWYRIVLGEGRNRVVRRLFEHYGLGVNRLLRIRFGSYRLPKDLPPGGWLELPYHR